jgi:predicted SnoaL-like aldol condensation-catalyzing enzyme
MKDYMNTPTVPITGALTGIMKTTAEENKALVLKAFDTLFNKRDYEAAASFWSENYIQHSSHIEPGRDGLFNLVRSLPDTLRYENAVIVADGDYVILHGRFSGNGQPAALIAADIVRMEYGRLAEHWDAMDSGQIPAFSPKHFIFLGLSLHGFWLVDWMRNAPRTEIQEIYQKLGDMVADGTLSAEVEHVYPLERFKEAFEQSLKSNRSGKILFKFGAH